jgi:Fe-S-cluster containining protein
VDAIFNCQQCGWCCQGEGGIALSPERIEALAAFLGLSPERLLARYCRQSGGGWSVATGPDGFCLFYDHSISGCAVHPVKPEICSLWPYFPGNVRHPEGFAVAKNNCPGIGREVDFPTFREYARCHGLAPDDAETGS